jgi:hypothetical protein
VYCIVNGIERGVLRHTSHRHFGLRGKSGWRSRFTTCWRVGPRVYEARDMLCIIMVTTTIDAASLTNFSRVLKYLGTRYQDSLHGDGSDLLHTYSRTKLVNSTTTNGVLGSGPGGERRLVGLGEKQKQFMVQKAHVPRPKRRVCGIPSIACSVTRKYNQTVVVSKESKGCFSGWLIIRAADTAAFPIHVSLCIRVTLVAASGRTLVGSGINTWAALGLPFGVSTLSTTVGTLLQ